MDLHNHPTQEDVISYLDAHCEDFSRWMGQHGASPTPGLATIKMQATQPQYAPTYGYVTFAGQTMCWRIFSQPGGDFARGLYLALSGRDLRAELQQFCARNMVAVAEVLDDGQWRRA